MKALKVFYSVVMIAFSLFLLTVLVMSADTLNLHIDAEHGIGTTVLYVMAFIPAVASILPHISK